MANAKQHFIMGVGFIELCLSVLGNLSLEMPLRLNSLNPRRLTGYYEESAAYFGLIRHNSDLNVLKPLMAGKMSGF